jgi:hypothetical protein
MEMKLKAKDRAYMKVVEGFLADTMSNQEAISILVNGGFSTDAESAQVVISMTKTQIAQMRIDKATGVK